MAQSSIDSFKFLVTVTDQQLKPVEAATIILLKDNKLIKAGISDAKGTVVFENIAAATYTFSIMHNAYSVQTTGAFDFPSTNSTNIVLRSAATTLQEVSINSKKPLIQHTQGKTIVNVDAAVTNAGTTVLEVLEKSPGVMVDKNGGIALQGKAAVLVLIDDKPTYLSGTDLNNLLSSMSSSQVEQIELMTNPPAKYDASGNAGIINIKTKKNKVKGFNGSVSFTPGQGFYPKKNGSLLMNYRTGKFNSFLTYSINSSQYLTDIYALRKYYDANGKVTAILDQPTYFSGKVLNNTLKLGVDYFASSQTTIGIVLGGGLNNRKGAGDAGATWLNAAGTIDSAVATTSSSNNDFKNGSVNVNLRHSFNKQQDLAIDIDWLNYDIVNDQQFNNHLQAANGYNQASRGNIPATLKIVSAKADYTLRFGTNNTFLSGFKTSYINTDNIASYQNFDGISWKEDYGKSNHFLYRENINALYSSIETKQQRFSMQAGLRYEFTGYDAHQLGNVLQKDSAFTRNYSGLFPSGYVSYQMDSANSFTVTVGRRIDRPAFQTLNPFTFIINKYTYQNGNPYIIPQYSWNVELSHQYKEFLTTAVSYSYTKNYFSQIFLTDSLSGLLYYSQGNVGRANNIGASATLILAPLKWWSFTMQAIYNHKELKGYNGNASFHSDINQLNINLNNQFSFAKKYAGEVSGFYTTRARNDLQEELYPTGQLSLGVSRPVLKKKGTLKISLRDIFYTNAMEGLTQFTHATEYFIVRRDSRVVNLSFTYRFGKAYKISKRSNGSAGDEIQRVGSGG
jgi:iron complex outermembrane receptor protein